MPSKAGCLLLWYTSNRSQLCRQHLMMDCVSPAGKLHSSSSLHADLLLSAMTKQQIVVRLEWWYQPCSQGKVMLTSQSSLLSMVFFTDRLSAQIPQNVQHPVLLCGRQHISHCLSTFSCIFVDRHVAPDGVRTPWCMAPTAAWA